MPASLSRRPRAAAATPGDGRAVCWAGEVPTDLQVSPREFPFTEPDLTAGTVLRWAVKSLYLDEALPRGPLVQWLLQSLVGVKFTHKDLRGFVETTSGLYTEPLSSKKLNFCVLLEEPPAGFTGFVSEEDVVEELEADVWEEAACFLAQGGWPKADDASHKYYVVTSWLQDVSALLGELSFGRVLSIVRCSAYSVGLLGHRGGLLVPYAHSEECERRLNACTCQPTHVAPDERYVKTWTELQDCLRALLFQQPFETLEVSKVKSMFRTRFRTELSETVFGHRCLSKLLGDPELGDEFLLETIQGNRYMLRFSDKAAAAHGITSKAPSKGGNSAVAPGAAIARNDPGPEKGGAAISVPGPPQKICLDLALVTTAMAAGQR